MRHKDPKILTLYILVLGSMLQDFYVSAEELPIVRELVKRKLVVETRESHTYKLTKRGKLVVEKLALLQHVFPSESRLSDEALKTEIAQARRMIEPAKRSKSTR